MQKAKFRITDILIEGFRGFTAPQTVEIARKNVFIFGSNGRGKSSIVEAIRWCLFGAPSGGDIEVRNTFYGKQECRVTLVLDGPNDRLIVQRELRPGHERSRQIIRDQAGKEQLARDVLPQLTRLGHHESTQVIFAAQHAAGRQATSDISEFGTVLCFYLRLEDVPRLLEKFHHLEDVRRDEGEQLSHFVEVLAHQYRDELSVVNARLSGLLRNPPWGDQASPTGAATQRKITKCVNRFAQLLEQQLPSGLSLADSLLQAERWIETANAKEKGAVDRRKDALVAQVSQAVDPLRRLEEMTSTLTAKKARRTQLNRRLKALLHARTLKSLRAYLKKMEQTITVREIRFAIAERAKALCVDHEVHSCPACGTAFDQTTLMSAVEAQCCNRRFSAHDLQKIEKLRDRLETIDQIKRELEDLDSQIEEGKTARVDLCRQLAAAVGHGVVRTGVKALTAHVEGLRQQIRDLNRESDDFEAEKRRRVKEVRDLQQELTFHADRDRIAKLECMLTTGLNGAHDLLKDYRNLLTTAVEIRTLVDRCFRDALDKALPTLDEMLTDVYGRLTQQVSYDRVRVYHHPERTGSLELRVASSRIPGQTFPTNVLNGQASKALHLVPYFVFSRFQPEIMDLDLLLIDDPSESFDPSHVGLLVQELGEAARHAQLVVATHEQEKFESRLVECLAQEPYLVITVESFDPLEGPRFEFKST